MKKIYNVAFLVFLLQLFTACKNTPSKDARPNIIFILADDFGYMDVQGYAQHTLGVDSGNMYYETPNLDKLMGQGVAFSQAYANQLCSPTRASLLTGKYAARVGVTTATGPESTYYNQDMETPEGSYIQDALYHSDPIKEQQAWMNGSSSSAVPAGTQYDNGRDEMSIAEALKDYHSAFIGKWHIGGHSAKGYQPSDQGFEELVYWDAPGSVYFDWKKEWMAPFGRKKSRYARYHDPPKRPESDFVLGNIGEETGEKYLTDDMSAQAVSFIRKRSEIKDEPFFLYFCHFAVHTPLEGKEEDIAHFESKETKGWNGHVSPVYASMVKSLDSSVGSILNVLEETGLEDNTLVVFMSDNGGIDTKVVHRGTYTDNSPLLGGKACLTEGGIRVPLIFRWKNKIDGGQWCDVPVDCSDMLPTFADIAGYNAKEVIEKNDLDGRSIAPLLSDVNNKEEGYTKDTRYWHYPFNVIYNSPFDLLPLEPHSAIREGDHKLIFDWYGRLYLFDIQKDPYEKNNLAKQMPDRTNDLFDKLMRWTKDSVKETYRPYLNKEYAAEKEERSVPFVNLIETWNEGENVAETAN
ncbi:MAG: sulfatase [Eudoraea sp.]|nr:sulfatase [Eudoraea sp.]